MSFRTPRGNVAFMNTRPDTVDHDICASSMIEDEYKLGTLPELTGLAIDVGAHIGAVTIALALDNPTLRVKAVEIVPENVEMLRLNIAENGVADRVEIIERAAGGPDEASRTCYMRHRSHPGGTQAYVNKHRYIGNSFWSPSGSMDFDADAVDIDCVCLSDLATEPVSFIKIDAEGAEWQFLADKAALPAVQCIVGEYHWDYVWQGDASRKKPNSPKRPKRKTTAQAEMHRLLSKTHHLIIDSHPTIGHFTATLR
jgi:FkbM family methyltransferase